MFDRRPRGRPSLAAVPNSTRAVATFAITSTGELRRAVVDIPKDEQLPPVSVALAPGALPRESARLLRALADHLEDNARVQP